MKILVIGANSYVGARIYFELAKAHEVVGTFHSHPLSKKFVYLDVVNREEVSALVKSQKPEVIVHAANNANARWCEANPEEATLLNQSSTKYLTEAAREVEAKVIYISSFAAWNLNNVYGRTKFESEKIMEGSGLPYFIIRPSLILGFSPNTTNDRPFNRLLKNINQGTSAVYDTSWKFQPSYLGHICGVIKIAVEKDLWGKTVAIATNELKSRYDIAKDILTPFGIEVKPADANDTTLVIQDDLSSLKNLNLPVYAYKDMIARIVEEIKNRGRYILS